MTSAERKATKLEAHSRVLRAYEAAGRLTKTRTLRPRTT